MSSAEIISTGVPGPDYARSEGRGYFNVRSEVNRFSQLEQLFSLFQHKATQERGRRRVVVRAVCTANVVNELLANQEHRDRLPLEVLIPLNIMDPQEERFIVMLGQNVHSSEAPEWNEVYQDWQQPQQNRVSPLDRVARLQETPFQLTSQINEADIECLAQIWKPFGWTPEGVASFIERFNAQDPRNTNAWFSGVRNTENNELASACMGEPLHLNRETPNRRGVQIIEGTEYGTLRGMEGRGLCSAAVIGLHAQILNNHLYDETAPGIIPIILSEFNLSVRSDRVGRHAGMTLPLVEICPGLEDTPIQILRRNVSVLDGKPVNGLSSENFGDGSENYQYWRNFIMGALPYTSIQNDYSREQVEQIYSFSNFQKRNA